ncbi:hypothetical protein [Paracoccus spongiarum]|uniref:Uncharacterized protein n=1 Tax=Paracoccus spongiarum TaxID=3064387 RepID=A0ABT9J9G2_9RHOB|nr:hypothetical protein [Paracoccus sp. 2205BS29-5]MDP5306443.1 hypothetical protein [Paracoccus sp. 2205BS29-5]
MRGASCRGWRAQLHRRAWQQLRDEDLPGGIMIEDGARLMPGFVEFLLARGYLHADLTQFSHGRARAWLWGGCEASANVALRPLAASTGLASGYALSWRGAGTLLAAAEGAAPAASAQQADWPCDIARLGALVTRPMLVEPPDWLADAAPMPARAEQPARPFEIAARRAEGPDWRDLAAATLPVAAPDPGRAAGRARAAFAPSLPTAF